MLAYYVEWHMREAWSRPSSPTPNWNRHRWPGTLWHRQVIRRAAGQKTAAAPLEDNSPDYCFRTLVEHLGSIGRNTCRANLFGCRPTGTVFETFELTPHPTGKLREAYDVLRAIDPD